MFAIRLFHMSDTHSNDDQANNHAGWTDQKVETILGNVLRTGVIVSAVVVLIGAVIYLSHHAANSPDYRSFKGEPIELRSVAGILKAARAMSGRGIIQLGLLLLIATPVMRVLLSFFSFIKQRDKPYVVITLIVFIVLMYSIFMGT
jgi:uncharacterized membrane protein